VDASDDVQRLTVGAGGVVRVLTDLAAGRLVELNHRVDGSILLRPLENEEASFDDEVLPEQGLRRDPSVVSDNYELERVRLASNPTRGHLLNKLRKGGA
jgi:hypothetical protein